MRTGLPCQLHIWSDVFLAALNIGLRKTLRLSLGSVGASVVAVSERYSAVGSRGNTFWWESLVVDNLRKEDPCGSFLDPNLPPSTEPPHLQNDGVCLL